MKTTVLNMKNEKAIRIAVDILICIISAVAVWAFFAGHAARTGVKNLFVLNILHGAGTIYFMSLFEEYGMFKTKRSETMVDAVLSNIYPFLFISLFNLIFFRDSMLLAANSALLAVNTCLMLAACVICYKIINNSRFFSKPKLLIIGTEDDNLPRIKRMKYGTLETYDSWYEKIEPGDDIDEFISAKMQKFDGVCLLDDIEGEAYQKLINEATRLNKALYTVPKLIDINRSYTRIVRFEDVMAFYSRNYYIGTIESFFKRAFDIAASLAGTVIAAIPMLIIALAIKLDSKGPVFYKQIRLTKDKREFYIYKFRTMINDAEKQSGPVFAQKSDPRITRVGKILRSLRLDELPQLLNILKGDMSVVGPRPERPFFVEHFEKAVENYNYRFAVKAGLTSLSHVYGRYSTYIKDRTMYDLLYISRYSFLLDMKIIIMTTKTMFLKSAAEGNDEFKADNEFNISSIDKSDVEVSSI